MFHCIETHTYLKDSTADLRIENAFLVYFTWYLESSLFIANCSFQCFHVLIINFYF